MTHPQNPFSPEINDREFERWVAQFSAEEMDVISPLLDHFRYYPSHVVASLCVQLFQLLPPTEPGKRRAYVPAGVVAKEGSAIAYFFQKQNGLDPDEFLTLEHVLSGECAVADLELVFLDDYIGTGTNAIELWRRIQALYGRGSRLILAVLTATGDGIDNVGGYTSFEVYVADDRPLPAGLEEIFPDPSERDRAQSILERLGKRAFAQWPLGYGHSAALVAFFYGTPDNTLPIFWSSEAGWIPLFPRNAFTGPHAFEENGTTLPTVGPTELETFDEQVSLLAEDAAASRVLISEFQVLSCATAVSTAFSALRVEQSKLASLLSIINEVKVHAHEQAPVTSHLVILPPGRAFGSILVPARAALDVDNRGALMALAELAGQDGCVIIDATGSVRGLAAIPTAYKAPAALSPRRLSSLLAVSSKYRAAVFTSDGRGKATLLYNGAAIVHHRSQTWYPAGGAIPSPVLDAAQGLGCSISLIQFLYRLSLSLSDEGMGALFSLGDHEQVLGLCTPAPDDPLDWQPLPVHAREHSLVMGLLSADGASVIDSQGTIHVTRATVSVPPGTEAVVESGRGTKHRTAARLSAITQALAFAVSVDGRISVYLAGNLVDGRYA